MSWFPGCSENDPAMHRSGSVQCPAHSPWSINGQGGNDLGMLTAVTRYDILAGTAALPLSPWERLLRAWHCLEGGPTQGNRGASCSQQSIDVTVTSSRRVFRDG